MTDNEIIKAYELCFAEKGTSYTCAVCPYHQFGELCKVNRDKDALDLINRQQATIEALQAENKQLQSELTIAIQNHEHAKEVLERLQKTTHRATQRFMKAHKELQAAKAENEILAKNADTAFQDGLNEAQDLYAEQVKAEIRAEAISDVLKKLLSLEDVYAKVEGEFVEWDPCVELEYLFPREFEQAYSTEEEGADG